MIVIITFFISFAVSRYYNFFFVRWKLCFSSDGDDASSIAMLPLSVWHIALKKVFCGHFLLEHFYFLLFYVLNGNFRQRKHIAAATVVVFVQTSASCECEKVKPRKIIIHTQRHSTVGFVGIIACHSARSIFAVLFIWWWMRKWMCALTMVAGN